MVALYLAFGFGDRDEFAAGFLGDQTGVRGVLGFFAFFGQTTDSLMCLCLRWDETLSVREG